VNRQKELASQQATAPLQQQIADLNKLISDQQAQIAKLQQQMQLTVRGYAMALDCGDDEIKKIMQRKK
jgi:flagellar biosynthesis chaperone FliJ